MPNPGEALLIALIVVVVLTAYRLPNLGDSLAAAVRGLFRGSRRED
jgi:Sec-independent protein translocase protein TatA